MLRLWEDPWLKYYAGFKPITKTKNQAYLVRDLMRSGGFDWDIEEVNKVLWNVDVETVLKTTIVEKRSQPF